MTTLGVQMNNKTTIVNTVIIFFTVAIVLLFFVFVQLEQSLTQRFTLIAYSIMLLSLFLFLDLLNHNRYCLSYLLNTHHFLREVKQTIEGETIANKYLLSKKLSNAIAEDIIDIHYQKIIDIRTNKTLYIEQLARWYDSTLGYIEPERLIEIARSSEQLRCLDHYLIDKSIRLYRKHCLKTKTKPTLSINLTPETFLQKNTLAFLLDTTEKYAIPTHYICLEISETTFVNDHRDCLKAIENYKREGFLIALDDFGKSYSTLSLLESIDYDVIKIDQLFTKTIERSKTQEIVRMIQKISMMSNKQLIVEGVETRSQKEELEKLKCYVQQGFYFHYPEKFKF